MAHDDGAVDAAARATLAADGLDLRLVPPEDRALVDAWGDAVSRGFLGGERTEDARAADFELQRQRRRLGVYDDSGPAPELPVGTFADWTSELSVPGGAVVPALAISSVTVAPTHRRRGVARALMEGELRRAAAAGLATAILTVSESTIYGRYGFGPAADSASWRIDTRRAGWNGPTPVGRVDFIPRAAARTLVDGLHARTRGAFPGEAPVPADYGDELLGTRGEVEDARKIRAVRYTGVDGGVDGLLVYSVEATADFTSATAKVRRLLAVTDDAYAALWRFVLTLDLVAEVRVSELSVDEPLRWMIADPRAATVTTSDHHYVRILDVAAVFSARRYGAAGAVVLDVDDPLGLSGGRYLLDVGADGVGMARPWHAAVPGDAVHVTLGAVELAMLSLGGVSAASLAAAGRIETSDVTTVARILGWHVPARLSFWY